MANPLLENREYQLGLAGLKRACTPSVLAAAMAQAEEAKTRYVNRRGSMVVDVVTSRQRQYKTRVLPMVARWEHHAGGSSLSHLINAGVPANFGLRAGEADTIFAVAGNLLELDDDDEKACRLWAERASSMVALYELDETVGAVPGIGMALYLYLLMRCGAEVLKPDSRVKKALQDFGFPVPKADYATLVLCDQIAADLDIPLTVLDKIFWSKSDTNRD